MLSTYADNICAQESLLEVDGLHIRCAACRVRDDGLCEWSEDRLLKIGACETLVERMLLSGVSAPNPKELKTFLLRKVRERSTAEVALEVLLQNPEGETEFNSAAQEFLHKYHELIEARLRAQRLPSDVLRQLWELPESTEKNSTSLKFFSRVAAADPQLGFTALIERLSGTNWREDLSALRVFSNNLRKDFPELSGKLKSFRIAVHNCVRTFSRNTVFDCALPQAVQEKAAVKYLEQIKINLLMTAWHKKTLSPEVILDLSRSIDFKNFGTPEYFAMVFEATESLQQRNPQLLNNSAVQQLLVETAKIDPRFQQFQPTGVKFWLWIGVAVAALLAAAAVVFKRASSPVILRPDTDLSQDRAELRDLLSYFGLSPRAQEGDLVKRYRELAKETHPDSSDTAVAEFAEVNAKYRRAKELMNKR